MSAKSLLYVIRPPPRLFFWQLGTWSQTCRARERSYTSAPTRASRIMLRLSFGRSLEALVYPQILFGRATD